MRKRIPRLASVVAVSLPTLFLPAEGRAGGILPDALDYSVTLNSQGAAFDVPMSVAFDGTFYYGVSGGGSGVPPLQKYDPIAGGLLRYHYPGSDFRSLFNDAAGNVYARAFGSNEILRMTSPEAFSPFLTLDTGAVQLEDQAAVVLSGDGSVYASRRGNALHFWNATDGSYQSSVTLSDYGTVFGENASGATSADVTLASFGAYYLTYLDGSDEVYAWDTSGNRVGNMVLANNNGGNASSFSYANGHLFTNSDGYHGYELAAPPIAIPEPGAACLLLVGLGASLARRRSRRV